MQKTQRAASFEGFPKHKTFDTGPFRFSVRVGMNQTVMRMTCYTDKIYTSFYSSTYKNLLAHLPGIFNCQCFNRDNKNFAEESKNTEIAHLFEHIFIQYFCEIKANYCNCAIECEGYTEWDWVENPPGTFTIILNIGKKDLKYIAKALERSIALFNKIIAENEDEGFFPLPQPVVVPVPIYVPSR